MTGASELTLGNTVDWEFAASVGERLARPAPPSTEYTRRQVIDELTVAAEKAEPPVRDVTGLIADGVVPPARVVDRPAWIRSAAESMRAMTHGSAKPRGFSPVGSPVRRPVPCWRLWPRASSASTTRSEPPEKAACCWYIPM